MREAGAGLFVEQKQQLKTHTHNSTTVTLFQVTWEYHLCGSRGAISRAQHLPLPACPPPSSGPRSWQGLNATQWCQSGLSKAELNCLSDDLQSGMITMVQVSPNVKHQYNSVAENLIRHIYNNWCICDAFIKLLQ